MIPKGISLDILNFFTPSSMNLPKHIPSMETLYRQSSMTSSSHYRLPTEPLIFLYYFWPIPNKWHS